MDISQECAYSIMIEYLQELNRRVSNDKDINRVIENIKKMKNDKVNEAYIWDEQNVFIDLYDILKGYYDETKSDMIGALLGQIVLFEDGTTSDPASWNDWMVAVNKIMDSKNYIFTE